MVRLLTGVYFYVTTRGRFSIPGTDPATAGRPIQPADKGWKSWAVPVERVPELARQRGRARQGEPVRAQEPVSGLLQPSVPSAVPCPLRLWSPRERSPFHFAFALQW